jgi:hypothetical protein
MSATATITPLEAKASEMARPIPEAPPVTRASLFTSGKLISSAMIYPSTEII